jgi:hypothetical protein
MNIPLVLAAGSLALVGAVHSVLGEVMVFRRLRGRGGIVPTGGQPVLGEYHVRIVWGSWHLVTMLGWALSALLWRLGTAASDAALAWWVTDVVGITTLASGVLVFVATRGNHPAWFALMSIAALMWWS